MYIYEKLHVLQIFFVPNISFNADFPELLEAPSYLDMQPSG